MQQRKTQQIANHQLAECLCELSREMEIEIEKPRGLKCVVSIINKIVYTRLE